MAATSEYLGMVTKQPNYERFARSLARFVVLLFASGAALAITFVLALVTLFPVFFSYLQNIFFWVFLVEAFMFLGQIIIVYAWYNVWDKLAYRKSLHVVFGFVAGFFGLMAMTMIDAVASFMLTPPEVDLASSEAVARSFLNQTMVPLNMHRFVGNFSYVGFLVAGWAGLALPQDDARGRQGVLRLDGSLGPHLGLRVPYHPAGHRLRVPEGIRRPRRRRSTRSCSATRRGCSTFWPSG